MAKCLCPNPIPLPKMSCTLLFWKFMFSDGNDLCSEPQTEICFANGSLLLYLLFAQNENDRQPEWMCGLCYIYTYFRPFGCQPTACWFILLNLPYFLMALGIDDWVYAVLWVHSGCGVTHTARDVWDIFFSVCQHWCTDLQNMSHMHSSHVADYFFTYTNQCVAFASYAGGKMHVCVLIFKQRLWWTVVFIG